MSKALSDLEDFFDGMVGDDEGFDVVCEAIEYMRMVERENIHYNKVISHFNSIFDDIWLLVEKGCSYD